MVGNGVSYRLSATSYQLPATRYQVSGVRRERSEVTSQESGAGSHHGRFFMPGVRGKGVGKARGTESVTSLLAIRKSYRKEMQIMVKSEAIAKLYVIEN